MRYFSRCNQIIMPTWFPWIFVGGIIFICLSFLGAKYKDISYKKHQFLQDFISGAILIGFLGVMMPDMFPVMNIPIELPTNILDMSSDVELQVGPPRLVGR